MTYYFQVKLQLLDKKFLGSAIKDALLDAAEIVLTSNEYTDYEMCIKDLQTFMSLKSKDFSSKREKYVIRWEKNPFIMNEDMQEIDEEKQGERWFSNEVLKMFLVQERNAKAGIISDTVVQASMFSEASKASERSSNSLH